MAQETGAILTPSQREYLRGESDVEPDSPQERMIRSRIRDRLRTSMGDALLILREMDPEDIRTAFERRALPTTDREPGEPLTPEHAEEIRLENGMAAMVGMIFLAGLERSGEKKGGDLTRTTFLQGRVEKGVRVALNELGVSVRQLAMDLVVDLGSEFDTLGGLEPAALAEYSPNELLQARLDDVITDEQFLEAMEEKGMAGGQDGEE